MDFSVIIEPSAYQDLSNIFNYIEKNGSIYRAKNFISQLQQEINSLSFMPQRCRDSYYYKDKKAKDLIYKGYTIPYYIEEATVYVVAVFRQKNY